MRKVLDVYCPMTAFGRPGVTLVDRKATSDVRTTVGENKIHSVVGSVAPVFLMGVSNLSFPWEKVRAGLYKVSELKSASGKSSPH